MTVSTAIVTIIDVTGATIGDFEFPLQIPIKDIASRFIEILKAMDYEKYNDVSEICLKFKNKELKEQDTFFDKGIWDGSFVELSCNRG